MNITDYTALELGKKIKAVILQSLKQPGRSLMKSRQKDGLLTRISQFGTGSFGEG